MGEKEIEEKLSKMSTSEESKDDAPRAYKPPARRDDGDRRRDDRGYDRDRRDDRGGYDRRDDRGSSSGYDRDGRDDRGDRDEGRNRDEASEEKEERKKTPEPQMKKYEEPKPANVVAQNKFAFLQ